MAEPDADDQQAPLPSSFGWTSSRADYMYFALHAPLERMLEYFGIGPIPDAPPPDLDGAAET